MDMSIFQKLAQLGYEPNLIIDGGANIGNWAKEIRNIFPESRVICVEGNPKCIEKLSEFEVLPYLIGDHDGEVTYFSSVHDPFQTGNSIFKERTAHFDQHSYSEVKLPIRRLDSLLSSLGIRSIGILKVDLQGSELRALRGTQSLLSSTDLIVFEASFVEYNRNQPLFSDLHDFMSEKGFVIFDIIDRHQHDGITFQADFVYVNSGSSFRPFFSSQSLAPKVSPKNIYRWELGRHSDRSSIVKELEVRKTIDPEYSIIDVGGAVEGWSIPVLNSLIDLNPKAEHPRDLKIFQFDINNKDGWDEVLSHVKSHGKFDFSICSHTLEDVRDPVFVCKMLASVSREGFVAFPSKFIEFQSLGGAIPYRGYIHHRWIFTIKDGNLVGMPKLPVIEYLENLHALASNSREIDELRVWWYNSIPLEVVNKDYMGPDPHSVLSYYDVFLNDDLQIPEK